MLFGKGVWLHAPQSLRLLTCHQVKCCGRQPTCTRCIDKNSYCHYSVSMVGKVVGKRKRQEVHGPRGIRVRLDDWNITVGPHTTIPSPAPTHASVRTSKSTSASAADWTSYITFDDEQKSSEEIALGEHDVQHPPMETGSSEEMSNMTPATRPGLLTPSESPPNTHFNIYPASNTAGPVSVMPAAYFASSQHHLPPQTAATSMSESHANDGQMLCLNLLGNLRRMLLRQHVHFTALLALVTNTNAVVNRILRQKSIRSDYTSQLMLSIVCIYLVNLCELLKQAEARLSQSPDHGDYSEEKNTKSMTATQRNQTKHTALVAVHDVRQTCSSVGDLLKRKPLGGFQVLGRQESAHVDLEIRLDQVLSCFRM